MNDSSLNLIDWKVLTTLGVVNYAQPGVHGKVDVAHSDIGDVACSALHLVLFHFGACFY